jgi:hypothetical protein
MLEFTSMWQNGVYLPDSPEHFYPYIFFLHPYGEQKKRRKVYKKH